MRTATSSTGSTSSAVSQAAAGKDAAHRYTWTPYIPFTLARFPSVPIGLLICFDMEFPETSRSYALAGAQVVISTHASGEGHGFASRVFAPARAAENHVCIVFSNFPSCALPEEDVVPADATTGTAATATAKRVVARPVAADAISVAYSGGSAVCAPTGDTLFAAAAYPCNRGYANMHGHVYGGEIVSSYYDGRASGEVTAALAAKGCISRPARVDATEGGVPQAVVATEAGDEQVIIVAYDHALPRYATDKERNPYLEDRRAELFHTL